MKKLITLTIMLAIATWAMAQTSGGYVKKPKPVQGTTTTQKSKPSQKPKPKSTAITAEQRQRILDNLINNMIYVEGGTFTMGATPEQGNDVSDREKPAHQVTLSSFYIAETEVTQELWLAVMGSNPSESKGANRPVTNINWDDCQTFIHKLNTLTGKTFRLPTEAEWEFAARGGNKSQGYKYSGSNTAGNVARSLENSDDSKIYPVKTKSPNELGIYDMSGNVVEWCQDWLTENYYSSYPLKDSSGSYRVIRGGCGYDSAESCRVSSRNGIHPNARWHWLGLRLAL